MRAARVPGADAGFTPDAADASLDVKKILQGSLPASSAQVIAALVRRCKELQVGLRVCGGWAAGVHSRDFVPCGWKGTQRNAACTRQGMCKVLRRSDHQRHLHLLCYPRVCACVPPRAPSQTALVEACESLQQSRLAEQGLRAQNMKLLELSKVRNSLLVPTFPSISHCP